MRGWWRGCPGLGRDDPIDQTPPESSGKLKIFAGHGWELWYKRAVPLWECRKAPPRRVVLGASVKEVGRRGR
jgi:hypothetical protein